MIKPANHPSRDYTPVRPSLKASTVESRLIPLIAPQSTLLLIDTWSISQSTVISQLTNFQSMHMTWSMLSWLLIKCRLSINWVVPDYHSGCPYSRVPIKMSIKCIDRGYRSTLDCACLYYTWCKKFSQNIFAHRWKAALLLRILMKPLSTCWVPDSKLHPMQYYSSWSDLKML